jgi:NADP-dependent 3-hydroxy acid dehydrogenase YdfG
MENSIIITGANSGIGLELVKQLANELSQINIIAISRNTNHLEELSYSNLQYYQCDISNHENLKDIVKQISLNYRIEGLINCAGTSYNGDFSQINHQQIEQMINVNISGLTNAIELILPLMRKEQHGTIINISSLADRYPRPLSAVYGATKAYVRSLSDSLRVSCAKDNIRVTNVAPALVDTPLLAKVGKNKGAMIEVSEFVKIIKFIYQLPQSVCIRDMVIAPTSYEG